MAKRKSSRGRRESTRARGAGARLADERSQRDDAAAKGDAAAAPPEHSLIDYLTGRAVLIAFIVMEVVAIVVMSPSCVYQRTYTAIRAARKAGDHETALKNLERLNNVFGRDAKDKPKTVFGRLVERYLKIDPNNHVRYLREGAMALVELERYDEAAALLEQLDPKLIPAATHARVLHERGDREAALKKFAVAAKKANDYSSNFHLGRDLYEHERYVEAALYLRLCVKDAKYGEDARRMLADIQVKLDIVPVDAEPAPKAAPSAAPVEKD